MDDAMRDGRESGAADGLLERVRALAEGRLARDETEALLLRAAAAPEDAALLDAFREVHAVTAVMDEDTPPCRVRFEDVEARIDAGRGRLLRSRALRAAAAVLVAGAAVAAWTVMRAPAVSTVELEAVRLAVAPPRSDPSGAAALAAAATLADYRPLRDGEPQWLGSLDVGRAVARATGRPVLLFIHHPTCPMCLELRGEAFQDADVQARLAQFVPVMVDVTELPESLAPFLQRGWPYLGALDADGDEVAAFPGVSRAEKLRVYLDDALRRCGREAPVAWGAARALAARLRDAVAAGAAGDIRREHAELTALATDDAHGAFGRAARQALDERGREAAEALRRAAASPAAATGVLDRAAARFAGTPWGVDIEHVREVLRETGRFPRLAPPPADRRF